MTGLVVWGPTALVMGLTVTASGTAQLGVSTVFASMAGLLTGAGDRNSSTVMRSGWAALLVVLGMAVQTPLTPKRPDTVLVPGAHQKHTQRFRTTQKR